MRLRFFVVGFVPGLGQLALGYALRGLTWFALFALAADTALLGGLLHLERLPLGWLGLSLRSLVFYAATAAVAVWLLAWADLYRITWGRGGAEERQRRDGEFQAALAAWLRGEWAEGERRLVALVLAEPLDPALWLWLARVRRSAGRLRAARAACARARRCDPEGLWSWELGLGPPAKRGGAATLADAT